MGMLDVAVPPSLRANHVEISEAQLDEMRASLKANFLAKHGPDYPETDVGRYELEFHTHIGLIENREINVPWLASVRDLKDLKILEIGCGTGMSTVTLAEQGAIVTGLDIDEPALRDNAKRLELYGQTATLTTGNATQLTSKFARGQFDMLIFWASLEHMTLDERLEAIRQGYALLNPGQVFAILGSPNTLHYMDTHTSQLPFYLWLSDDLASRYAKFSERVEFREAMDGIDLSKPDDATRFARWGRGVSYHDFELALDKPVGEINVISSMREYRSRQTVVRRSASLVREDDLFARFLRKRKPEAHIGFFEPYLNLAIERT